MVCAIVGIRSCQILRMSPFHCCCPDFKLSAALISNPVLQRHLLESHQSLGLCNVYILLNMHLDQ